MSDTCTVQCCSCPKIVLLSAPRTKLSHAGAKIFRLCRDIFEAIYFNALKTSNELAKVDGAYASYEGSPMSKGIIQPDMWGASVKESRWDWPALRSAIAADGVRAFLTYL